MSISLTDVSIIQYFQKFNLNYFWNSEKKVTKN